MPQLIYVTDPIDHLSTHLDWFFGVPDAPIPPPDYRKLDQLYVALTGDVAYHGRRPPWQKPHHARVPIVRNPRRSYPPPQGNSNAIKHGFYRNVISDEQYARLIVYAEQFDLADELALTRVRLNEIVAYINQGPSTAMTSAATIGSKTTPSTSRPCAPSAILS